MMVKVQREYRVKTRRQGAAIEAVLWVDEEYRKGFRRIRLEIEDVTGENLNALKCLAPKCFIHSNKRKIMPSSVSISSFA